MFKPFSLLFFIAVFVWIVRIFITTEPGERIERTCQPVGIMGNLLVSGTALTADQFTGEMAGLMDSWEYGCRYMIWRSLYEKEYLKRMEVVSKQVDGPKQLEKSSSKAGGNTKKASDEK